MNIQFEFISVKNTARTLQKVILRKNLPTTDFTFVLHNEAALYDIKLPYYIKLSYWLYFWIYIYIYIYIYILKTINPEYPLWIRHYSHATSHPSTLYPLHEQWRVEWQHW